jgi:serine/threonine protein phosphatase 1
LPGFLLVHAGLNFNIENPFDDEHSMLWIKEYKVDRVKAGFRKLIHGHVPVSLDFIDLLRTSNGFDFIDLDNGIYMPLKEGFGNLVSLELTSMELKVQNNVDIP